MHEMSIIANVVDAVVSNAQKSGVKQVLRVTLVVGELHGAVDDLMERFFAQMTRGTIAAGAELELVKVPFRARCRDCGRVFPADLQAVEVPGCPVCGCRQFHVHSGSEFLIRDMEVI